MDLNAIIFPAPEYVIQTVEAHEGEIIFIPKKSLKNTEKVNERIFFENTTSNNFKGVSQNSQSQTNPLKQSQNSLSINSVKDEKIVNNNESKNNEKFKCQSNLINEKLYKEYRDSGDFIPCLLLQSKTYKKINKNFLIFFHGNAEDIFLARDVADRIRANLSMNILIVEYPGYSIYKDDKDSDKVLLDCLIIYDFLTETLKVEEENIYVFGRSIGTSPSLYLASKRKPAGLILMSPFTSVRAVAQNLVGNLFKFLISERFTNIEYVKEVTCPILFIHGQEDTLIPFEHTIRLKENCQCPYEVILPEYMNHNQFDYENDLIYPLRDFLRRHTGFRTSDYSDIQIPSMFFEVPLSVKEMINNFKHKESQKGISSCFCGDAERSVIREAEK